MIPSVSFISELYLTTLPYRKISLHYSPGPEILFNLKKLIHLSFKCKLDTAYIRSDMSIPQCDSHKDLELRLELILFVDLS